MLTLLKNLWQYRELAYTLARREVIARYKQSLLGPAWALLQPVALMLTFTLINSFVKLPSEGAPYPLFCYSALLPWTMFQGGVMVATPSIVINSGIIKKIYFPREVLPLSAVLVSFFDFLMASLVFLGMMVYYRHFPGYWVLLLPFLVLVMFGYTLGIGLMTSALGTFKRDVIFTTFFVLQIWMYASPVIYPLSAVPEKYRSFYLLNPMAGLIATFRSVLLHGHQPDILPLLLGTVGSVLTLVVGYTVFKSLERWYADVV
jgi:lipopolysaccharide transport system permease protein